MTRDQYPAAAMAIHEGRVANKTELVVRRAHDDPRYTELEPGSPMHVHTEGIIRTYLRTPMTLRLGLTLSPRRQHDTKVVIAVEHYLAFNSGGINTGGLGILKGAVLRGSDALDNAYDIITTELSREKTVLMNDKPTTLRKTIAYLRKYAPHLLLPEDI